MVCSQQQLDCTYGQVQQHFNSMENESENQLARRMCCTGEKIQCNTRHPVNRIASRTGPITSRNQGLAQTLVQQLQLCKDAPPTYYYIHTWRYYMNPFHLLQSWRFAVMNVHTRVCVSATTHNQGSQWPDSTGSASKSFCYFIKNISHTAYNLNRGLL